MQVIEQLVVSDALKKVVAVARQNLLDHLDGMSRRRKEVTLPNRSHPERPLKVLLDGATLMMTFRDHQVRLTLDPDLSRHVQSKSKNRMAVEEGLIKIAQLAPDVRAVLEDYTS